MAKRKAYPEIGTVSYGTMREEDLIPAFTSVLEEYAPERAAKLREEYTEVYDAEDWDEVDEEQAGYLCEALFDALREIAAPYTHFGTHEGDGSDYGFWPSIESLEEDARYQDGVIKVNAGDKWPTLGDDVSYVMEVTDHGNVTLYDAKTKAELWAIV